MKLVAYVVITAAILGFVAVALHGAVLGAEEAKVEAEIHEFCTSLGGLDGHARDMADPFSPTGARIHVEMRLPPDLLWLRIRGHEARYMVAGRGPRVVPLPCQVITPGGGPLVLRSGPCVVSGELVYNRSGRYVLLRAQ